jgi:hypothetical protein
MGSLTLSGITGAHLVRVLGNLIDNAIDACLSGRPPHQVTVTVREQGDELFVKVADTGPGLDPAELPRIVERGWSTKPPGEFGRGLGLSIVDQTVRRLGGLLALEPAPDGGAEFLLTLPLPDGRAMIGSLPGEPAAAPGMAAPGAEARAMTAVRPVARSAGHPPDAQPTSTPAMPAPRAGESLTPTVNA